MHAEILSIKDFLIGTIVKEEHNRRKGEPSRELRQIYTILDHGRLKIHEIKIPYREEFCILEDYGERCGVGFTRRYTVGEKYFLKGIVAVLQKPFETLVSQKRNPLGVFLPRKEFVNFLLLYRNSTKAWNEGIRSTAPREIYSQRHGEIHRNYGYA